MVVRAEEIAEVVSCGGDCFRGRGIASLGRGGDWRGVVVMMAIGA